MISQNCPKCGSSRIRRGYRPTPLFFKILFQYNLLCDGCNWEFRGFAVPGTVSHKPTKKKKNNEDFNVINKTNSINNLSSNSKDIYKDKNPKNNEKYKKRVKIRL